MHLLDGKKGILRPKKGLVFELRPQLAAFYRGPTPIVKVDANGPMVALAIEF